MFLLALSASARAAMPIVHEYAWWTDTHFSSRTSATSFTADPCGYGTVGYSSVTANCVGFAYTIFAQGGNASFTISQTTKTYSVGVSSAVASFNNSVPLGLYGSRLVASISTSTVLGVPSGGTYNGIFQAIASNPVINLSGLSTAATYWVWIEFGRQNRP